MIFFFNDFKVAFLILLTKVAVDRERFHSWPRALGVQGLLVLEGVEREAPRPAPPSPPATPESPEVSCPV